MQPARRVIGYARAEPGANAAADLERQVTQLRAADCEPVHTDTAEAFPNDGPALAEAINSLRPGDVLAVCRLDTITDSSFQWAFISGALEDRGASVRVLDGGLDTRADGDFIISVAVALEQWKHEKRRDPARFQRLDAWMSLIGEPAQPDPVAELEQRREEARLQIGALVAQGEVPPDLETSCVAALASFDRRIAELRSNN